MHADQFTLSEDVVRELIAAQFPTWRTATVRRVEASGTVHAIFRIGDDLAARFPLQLQDIDDAAELLRREADAARRFAAQSPFPATEPVAFGQPGEGYPLPWSVQTWVLGTVGPPDREESPDFAADLAALVSALRASDTEGRTFTGRGRGGDLRDHDAWVEECFRRSTNHLDVPLLRRLWAGFRDLPRTAPDVMSHGDLHPLNVIVTEGRLAGVLDTGGFAPADPALDAMAGWYFFGDVAREAFRAELGCDDLEWERSKAWTFQQCLGAIWYYVDSNVALHRMSMAALARVVAHSSS